MLVCALLVVLPLALAPLFAALAAFLPLELEVLEVPAPVAVAEPPPVLAVRVARVARVAPARVAPARVAPAPPCGRWSPPGPASLSSLPADPRSYRA